MNDKPVYIFLPYHLIQLDSDSFHFCASFDDDDLLAVVYIFISFILY